jgi:hypothetical protein
MGLFLKNVPARQGLMWVREGLKEFFRHPLQYTVLFITFFFAEVLCGVVPLVGSFLMLALVPLLTLAFMMAAAASLRGVTAPQISVYVAPWQHLPRTRKNALVTVCLTYAVVSIVCLTAVHWLDRGQTDAWLDMLMAASSSASSNGTSQPPVMPDTIPPVVLLGLLMRVTIPVLLSIPFWHAPALIIWSEQSAVQAMFSSTLALWRARGAYTVYGLGWMLAMIGLALVITLLTLVASPTMADIVAFPLGLAILVSYHVSLFFTFRDCFGHLTEDPPTETAG